MLSENNLCTYYDLDKTPGINIAVPVSKDRFAFLDDDYIIKRLLDFSEGNISRVTFFIPSIHCSSCIWLLEKLYRLDSAIIESRVNFVKKSVTITYHHNQTTLRRLVDLLASLGYEPSINLNDIEGTKKQANNKRLFYQIGIAGFAFGNSMLFSFPEYIDMANGLTSFEKSLFGILNILLAIPVLLYSASDYFKSAWGGVRKGVLNIDVPIAIGIFALFLRSTFEIFAFNSPGYLDSFDGLVFFLLIGKLFQEKTYANLSFERDYKSYFPVSVTVISENIQNVVPLSKLNPGDIVILKNQELVPADSILLSDEAAIDYSFVTGESRLIQKIKNEQLYAGGKLTGASVKIQIIKKVSQSYLTQLWNNDTFRKKGEEPLSELSNKIAKYFTLAVLLIASFSGVFWLTLDWHKAIDVVSSVLIIACPCALALSIPFTFGNTLRIFGKNRFYLKNIQAIERMKAIKTIIFDKTGTLTWQSKPDIEFSGFLSSYEKSLVKTLTKNSIHPISRFLFNWISAAPLRDIVEYEETGGKGMQAIIAGHDIRIGSASWLEVDAIENPISNASYAYLVIDGKFRGAFSIKTSYRTGLKSVISDLSGNYNLSLISGDNSGEQNFLYTIFAQRGAGAKMLFNQSPTDKQNYILRRQKAGDRTLMIGDGLNDAGALKQSDLGISISEDVNAFSPACDAILDATRFEKLPQFLRLARYSYNIVIISFILSFLYNLIGIGFAVSAALSPIVAAILMPASSITVVAFATLTTRTVAKKMRLTSWE